MIGRHLRSVQIEKGDLFYIPAGMIHAIGAGVLIAEVQENNNLLYRLCDYDCVNKNGRKRSDACISQAELQSIYREVPSLLPDTGGMSARNVLLARLALIRLVRAEEFWPAAGMLRFLESIQELILLNICI